MGDEWQNIANERMMNCTKKNEKKSDSGQERFLVQLKNSIFQGFESFNISKQSDGCKEKVESEENAEDFDYKPTPSETSPLMSASHLKTQNYSMNHRWNHRGRLLERTKNTTIIMPRNHVNPTPLPS